MKGWLKAALILLVLLAGGVWFWKSRAASSKKAAGVKWQTVAVKRGTLEATVGATGTVRTSQSAVVAWQVSGIVKDVLVSEGDHVAVDQTLAELREDSWPQALLSARTSLLSAQKQLDDLQRNAQLQYAQALEKLANAREQLKTAEWRYNNIVRYWDAEKAQKEYDKWHGIVISLQRQLNSPTTPPQMKALLRAQLESAKIQEQVAKNNLNPSEEDKAKATADYELAKAQVAYWQQQADLLKDGPPVDEVALLKAQIAAAQATLDLARLKAPFDGVVTKVMVKPGDLVAPGKAAFRIDKMDALFVDVPISEVNINDVHKGQKATLILDAATNRTYHGVVDDVDFVGTQTPTGIDFTVTVRLTDADELVKPGMTAAVTIATVHKKDVLLVPNRAIRTQHGQTVVYVLPQGATSPHPVPITLGAMGESYSEVLKGDLHEGDLVVLNPPTQAFNFFGGK